MIGLLQVAVCPRPGVDAGTPAWLYHRCDRARGAFSIYMTLAGILTLTLLATAAASLAGRAARARWFLPLWLIMLGGLIATYTRGAWLGFAAGVLALLPASRAGRVASSWAVSPRSSLGLAGGTRAAPSVRQHGRSRGGDGEGAPLHVGERLAMWRASGRGSASGRAG